MQHWIACLVQRHSAAAKVLASIASFLVALTLSPRLQSLFVFVNFVNWPPFDPNNLAKPSPSWIHRLAKLGTRWLPQLEAFSGLARALPYTVQGPRGTLRGLRLPRMCPGEKTVLYFHGNAGNVAVLHRTQLYELLSAPPFNCEVIAVDYGGFGHSDSCWPNEATAVADALAILESLPPAEELVVWGHSLGTGIAVGALHRLMEQGKRLPGRLILEAPFTSVPDVPAKYFTQLPGPFYQCLKARLHAILSAHRMPTLERIGQVAEATQVSILHGRRDSVVPYEQGQELAAAAGAALYSFDQEHDDIVLDPTLPKHLEEILSVGRA